MKLLHYVESGQGEPLILLHSGGMCGEEWKPQMAPLARQFRVIAPDQPGHGQSPMRAERLTIGDIGRAVLELMDGLDLPRAHLVGSSMGGAVALWLAVHHPARVARLVLYRVSYRKNEDTHAGTREMADPAYWKSVGLDAWLSRIHFAQGGPEAWKAVIGRVSDALDPATSDHAHTLDTLRALNCPTLIVVGDRDPLVPLEHALAMFQAIPDAGLWVMPHASHVTASNTWRADAFAQEIARFLARR
ncbi:3-oxoadipate enol-lactonase [Plasticicumulans lactativorans]|uniref:3-oxoadipate enol-lactonase n=1 Tax=Plasticicumulans lactativorans TaxID=1133106 RepID=A0A4R2KU39_9GAMM|nr:alpha/beta fold hydrolase [Plasticicumulans lactativorans]TCO76382.1 3-oxoadipate enol-lactonase [Plasticicumulans lactativorans]